MTAKRAFLRVSGGAMRASSVLGGLLLLAIMLTIVFDVFARNVLGQSILGQTIVLAELALASAVFLGLGQAERFGVHVSASALVTRLPAPVRRGASVLGNIITIVTLGGLLLTAYQAAERAVRIGEARTGLGTTPVWPARIVITVGIALLLLATISRMLQGEPAWSSEGPADTKALT